MMGTVVGRPVAARPDGRRIAPWPLGRARRPSPHWPSSEDRVTDTDTGEPGITTREIEGVRCTNRAGIAALAGWKPGNSVNVRAKTDPDFPRPLDKIGRDYWYPFEGEHGVDVYLALLAERAAAKKPPPVEPGDPDELLETQQAAAAMHIKWSTFRSYVRYSIPIWEGRKAGRPLIPSPDQVTNYVDDDRIPRVRREWYRRTLAEHQAARPGPGTGAGRPTGRTTTTGS